MFSWIMQQICLCKTEVYQQKLNYIFAPFQATNAHLTFCKTLMLLVTTCLAKRGGEIKQARF